MNSKKCFKCLEWKPLTEFYAHKKMADGHLGKCKSCTRSDVKKRVDSLANDSSWTTKERKRQRDKTKTRYQNFPEISVAHNATRQLGKVKGSCLHHWSYNAPDRLDIINLSIGDHHQLHRYIVYDQEQMMYRRCDTGVLLDSKQHHIDILDELKKQQHL